MLKIKKSLKLGILLGCLMAFSAQNVLAGNFLKNKKVVYGLLTIGALISSAFFVKWAIKKYFVPVVSVKPDEVAVPASLEGVTPSAHTVSVPIPPASVPAPATAASCAASAPDARRVVLGEDLPGAFQPLNFSAYSFFEKVGKPSKHPMEDRTDICVDHRDFDYIGIFDGHGGDFYSDILQKELKNRLFTEFLSRPDIRDLSPAITNVFMQLNDNFDGQFKAYTQSSKVELNEANFSKLCTSLNCLGGQGSCAIAAILDKRQGGSLYVANAGDSRAILINKDGSVVLLSNDFKASNPTPEELRRISSAGGMLLKNSDGEDLRLGKELAVTRAFGDFYVKGITAQPEIIVVRNQMLQRAAFLVVACDGMWDAISNEDAARFIFRNFNKSKEEFCKTECAKSLFEHFKRETSSGCKPYCGLNGTYDDVSIVVVKLND